MRIPVDVARRICRAVFASLPTPEHIADVVTEALVEADLRGIDSHGIRLLPLYADRAANGQLIPSAEPATVRETATTTVLDARQGVGHYASTVTMGHACDKANRHGLGAAVVRQNNHNGALSHFAIQAARRGLIGIAATACAPRVTPYGGKTGLHGTNPIAYAVPRGEADPMVFDFSTGYSAAKLKAAADRGEPLPAGRFLNAAGEPSTDLEDLATGWILPVAGPIGFGLGLLVDVLTCALADSPIGRQIPDVKNTSGPYHGCFFSLAIDPGAFSGPAPFSGRVEALLEQVRATEPADPGQPVRSPGQRGWEIRRQRLRDGIPMDEAVWNKLLAELDDRGIDVASRRVGKS
jgi:LDH2 family malate/lactate/ureidoglycolate dehydrogenase